SAETASTSAPFFFNASAVSLSNATSRAIRVRAAPSAAKASATPRPMPRFAPVIKAILPSSLRISTSLSLFNFARVYAWPRGHSEWRAAACQFSQSEGAPRRIAIRAGDLFTDRRLALIIAAQLMKIVGINFDHMHMGDLLRMAHEHPRAEIVGVCDEAPERMR